MKLRNLALVFMCIASVSCVKQKLESTYNSQENRIDQYIEKNRISGTDTLRVVYNGGASRLVTKEGNGPELSADGNIAFYYAGYTFSGSISNSNLFSTNHQQTATQAGWTLSEEDAKALSINMNDYNTGIYFIQVLKKNNGVAKFDVTTEQRTLEATATRNINSNTIFNELYRKGEIEDNRYLFF